MFISGSLGIEIRKDMNFLFSKKEGGWKTSYCVTGISSHCNFSTSNFKYVSILGQHSLGRMIFTPFNYQINHDDNDNYHIAIGFFITLTNKSHQIKSKTAF